MADETADRGRELYEEARVKAGREADQQTKRAADGLRSLSSDFETMASQPDHTDTPAASWMRQGANQLDSMADYLDDRGFDGVVEDVSGYARRNPTTFLAATFGVGLVAGRIVRNAQADDGPGSAGHSRRRAPASTRSQVTEGNRGEGRSAPTRESPRAFPESRRDDEATGGQR